MIVQSMDSLAQRLWALSQLRGGVMGGLKSVAQL